MCLFGSDVSDGGLVGGGKGKGGEGGREVQACHRCLRRRVCRCLCRLRREDRSAYVLFLDLCASSPRQLYIQLLLLPSLRPLPILSSPLPFLPPSPTSKQRTFILNHNPIQTITHILPDITVPILIHTQCTRRMLQEQMQQAAFHTAYLGLEGGCDVVGN